MPLSISRCHACISVFLAVQCLNHRSIFGYTCELLHFAVHIWEGDGLWLMLATSKIICRHVELMSECCFLVWDFHSSQAPSNSHSHFVLANLWFFVRVCDPRTLFVLRCLRWLYLELMDDEPRRFFGPSHSVTPSGVSEIGFIFRSRWTIHYIHIYIYFHLNIISIIIKHPIMVEMKLFWTSVIQIKRTLEHPSNMQHALSWLHDCYDCYILHALMALDSRNHYMHVENLFEAEMLEPQLMALHLRDLGTPPDFWVWSLASQTW